MRDSAWFVSSRTPAISLPVAAAIVAGIGDSGRDRRARLQGRRRIWGARAFCSSRLRERRVPTALCGSLEHGPVACAPSGFLTRCLGNASGIVSGIKLRWADRLESLCSLFPGAQAASLNSLPACRRNLCSAGYRTPQASCLRSREENGSIYNSSAICTAFSAAPFNN